MRTGHQLSTWEWRALASVASPVGWSPTQALIVVVPGWDDAADCLSVTPTARGCSGYRS